jgi:hypothetical protein
MKVIIAGSRSVDDYGHIVYAIGQSGFTVEEVVSGTARGADQLGELWARRHFVCCTKFPADWNRLGKQAGYVRNQRMAEYADALIAIWDGQSRGTKHMIDIMRKQGKPVFVRNLSGAALDVVWPETDTQDEAAA